MMLDDEDFNGGKEASDVDEEYDSEVESSSGEEKVESSPPKKKLKESSKHSKSEEFVESD